MGSPGRPCHQRRLTRRGVSHISLTERATNGTHDGTTPSTHPKTERVDHRQALTSHPNSTRFRVTSLSRLGSRSGALLRLARMSVSKVDCTDLQSRLHSLKCSRRGRGRGDGDGGALARVLVPLATLCPAWPRGVSASLGWYPPLPEHVRQSRHGVPLAGSCARRQSPCLPWPRPDPGPCTPRCGCVPCWSSIRSR